MKTICAAALLIASAVMLSSCASTSVPPLAQGNMPVIILPATYVQIVQATARQDGKNVVVAGQLQRKKVHHRVIPKGHVDVALVDEQGRTLQQIATRYEPSILPRMDGMKSSFLARIPTTAPEGSFVSVKFHSGSHDI